MSDKKPKEYPSYVFFGTPSFGKYVLESLISRGFIPLAIVTNPDKPSGRKKIITAPPVKSTAKKLIPEVPIFQPLKLSDIKKDLESIGADLFIIAAYGKIISEAVMNIPKYGSIGIHPSLLPQHRGPSPIQQTILDGDDSAGITIFLMDMDIDHGPIVVTAKADSYEPNKYSYLELEESLGNLGGKTAADLLSGGEKHFKESLDKAKKQNHATATFTKKFTQENGEIEIKKLMDAIRGNSPETAEKIHRKILALNPEPGTWTIVGDKRLKLLKSDISNGVLKIKMAQKEGKKSQIFSEDLLR